MGTRPSKGLTALLAVALVATVFASAEDETPSGVNAPEALAIVNGEPITAEDLRRRVGSMHESMLEAESKVQGPDILGLLQRVINAKLIVQEAQNIGLDELPEVTSTLAMGRKETAREFGRRSQAWRHLLDPQTLFFRPRRNGQWMQPYDPRRVDFHHTEANGWQYRFAAPHNVRDHIEALGGDEAFEAALDSLFSIDSATTGREQLDITGRIGQYAHGNEPSHHVAWLSHFTGRPWRSAARVAEILDRFYSPTPDGITSHCLEVGATS